MSEFLQGLLVCLIGGSFFALIMAPCMLSGRISREEEAMVPKSKSQTPPPSGV